MPGSRHAYWIIVAGQDATAFRARRAEDLLPTLKQLQRTQPDAVLKWFERGRIWDSPDQAADALRARRQRPSGASRGRDWRPGGEHRDPRAKYKLTRDQKRARFKRRQTSKRSDKPSGSESFGKRPRNTGVRPKRGR